MCYWQPIPLMALLQQILNSWTVNRCSEGQCFYRCREFVVSSQILCLVGKCEFITDSIP